MREELCRRVACKKTRRGVVCVLGCVDGIEMEIVAGAWIGMTVAVVSNGGSAGVVLRTVGLLKQGRGREL